MRMRLGFVVLAFLWIAAAGTAETASISLGDLSCLPTEGNGVLKASVTPEAGGTTTRIYFRRQDHGAFYFTDMKAAGGGSYWGLFPRPDEDNSVVEYYSAVVDPYGNTLSRSDSKTVDVSKDCVVDLTPEEQGMANNLTVGETSPDQYQKAVANFLCDGVVTRIGADGIVRGDEVCRRCIVAVLKKEALIPLLAIPLCIAGPCSPEPPASPYRP